MKALRLRSLSNRLKQILTVSADFVAWQSPFHTGTTLMLNVFFLLLVLLYLTNRSLLRSFSPRPSFYRPSSFCPERLCFTNCTYHTAMQRTIVGKSLNYQVRCNSMPLLCCYTFLFNGFRLKTSQLCERRLFRDLD